jgi:hypothetical protein
MAIAKMKKDGEIRPVCPTHMCFEPAETIPDLKGRIAHCAYGKHAPRNSDLRLAFFEYCPERDYDRYYCGCYGWD